MLNMQYFREADLKETTDILKNPDRGFCRLHSFVVGEEWETSKVEAELSEEERLVMVLLNIGRFRAGALNDETIDLIEEILRFFTTKGKDIILRVAYDTEGRAMEREPYQYSVVRTHMDQVSKTAAKFGPQIFVYQGLLVGNWGEMHSSKYLKKQYLLELTDTCRKNLDELTYMAVRCPYQYRMICRPFTELTKKAAGTLGFFDDAILGSDTDMGTFAYPLSTETGWEELWARPKELAFVSQVCRYAPNGGETVYGDGYSGKKTPAEILADFGQMHLTYLNKRYDLRVLDNWKKTTCPDKGVWSGRSLYEYVEHHLGYRYIIRSCTARILPAKTTRKRARFTLEVENKGFACLYREALVRLIAVPENGGEIVVRTHLRLTEIDGGCTAKYRLGVNFPLKKEKYKIYLESFRACDRMPIYFANQSENGRVFLGTLQM